MTVRFMKGTSIAELEREMQQVPGFGPRRSGVIRSRQAGETAGVGSCRYVNVWRAEKEQGMDGRLYTAVDEEMPPAFYQILLRLLAEELPGSALTVRVGKLQEEGEKGIMFFKKCGTQAAVSGAHALRFISGACDGTGICSGRVSIEQ